MARTFDLRIDAQRWLTNELVKLDRGEWVSSCHKRVGCPRLRRPDHEGANDRRRGWRG